MQKETARKLSNLLSRTARGASKVQKVIIGSQALPQELKKK